MFDKFNKTYLFEDVSLTKTESHKNRQDGSVKQFGFANGGPRSSTVMMELTPSIMCTISFWNFYNNQLQEKLSTLQRVVLMLHRRTEETPTWRMKRLQTSTFGFVKLNLLILHNCKKKKKKKKKKKSTTLILYFSFNR